MSGADTMGGDGRRRWLRRALLTPYVWLLLFFLAPFLIILKISFADPLVALPPFTALLDWSAPGLKNPGHLWTTIFFSSRTTSTAPFI